MTLLSMDNEDFNKPGFFDLLVERKTYACAIYSLGAIPLNALYLAFSISGLIIGFALIPLWIGVFLLVGYFDTLWSLSKLEEKMYDKYLGIQLPKISKFIPGRRSAILDLKEHLNNRRSWMRVLYFSLKLFYSIILLIPISIFLGIGFSMIYIPIDSVFGRISFYGYYETDSFIEVIFFYFLASIVLIGLLHLVRYSVTLSSKMATRFLCR